MRKKEESCVCCTKTFTPKRKGSIYCSLNCFNESKIKNSRSTPEPEPVPGCRWVPLTQGKFALVDEQNFEEVSMFNWCAVKVRPNASGEVIYAKRTDTNEYLHRFVAYPSPDEEVDHINGNRLDNRLDNLYRCDKSGNGQNRMVKVGKSSGYKGVHATSSGNWVVRHCMKNVESYGGTFSDKEEAARKYDEIVRLRRIPNSTFNFPRSGERSALTGGVQS